MDDSKQKVSTNFWPLLGSVTHSFNEITSICVKRVVITMNDIVFQWMVDWAIMGGIAWHPSGT